MCQDDKCVYDLAVERRTIRRFKPEPVPRELLEQLVNAARLAPSAANVQPLEFIVVDDARVKAEVFPALKWAAYIAPAGDPRSGEEPAAYVVTLVNSKLREKMFEYDVGAAMQNMILTALAEGVGACWLLSIDRDKLRAVLGVHEGFRIDSVLALGYPAEEPAAEVMGESCRYWKDEAGRLHVPKRALAAVVHINRF
ncbi:MAG: nitroreductase [Candidatus Aminicenantes bacterium RBG_16_66_30]|nr:MAG: nitroreductase [Candidatus Aminicenantes bacterium RBG_16_66_30]